MAKLGAEAVKTLEINTQKHRVRLICMIMKVNTLSTIDDILSFMIIFVYSLISMQINIFKDTLYLNHLQFVRLVTEN